MGRPYKEELKALPVTYDWSINYDISGLKRSVRKFSERPLIAVGSGGSLTAALVLTTLHQLFTGNIATVMTPFELQRSVIKGRGNSICIITAGGGNNDVLNAFSRSIEVEPDHLTVLCASEGSKVSEVASAANFVDLIEFVCPTGKDGFLATNSLLAFSVLIGRAYLEEYSQEKFPESINELLAIDGSTDEVLKFIESQCKPVLDRDILSVLYGSLAKPCAIDLESKFTEAALGVVHHSDYRNFAHGRHHWFAKKQDTTGLLALADESEYEIASKTLALIPNEVPKQIVKLNNTGPAGIVEGVIWSLLITYIAGNKVQIDPGRPGVPEFGEQIYNLLVDVPQPVNGVAHVSENARVAVERKTGAFISVLNNLGRLEYWLEAYDAFISKLSSAKFNAIVFDYDGTLVDEKERFSPPEKSVIDEIRRLIDGGISIGIATGRGRSVRRDLQSSLPEEYWDKILIGYYNGAELGLLSDDDIPDRTDTVSPGLQPVITQLNKMPDFLQDIRCEPRKYQITLEPTTIVPEGWIWDMTQQLVQDSGISGVKVLRSSHSVDIIAPGVSKLAVVKRLKKNIGDDLEVLTIGDRGKWPGNDYELLHEELSLSVDEISANPACCWNFASSGARGVQATLEYLRAITVSESIASMDDKWTRI